MSVDFKDKDYNNNIKYLEITNDLYVGTRNIKSAKYLNRYQLEDDDSFNVRLNDSTLYNFFKKSVDNLSSILFRKSTKIDYKVKFECYVNNIDNKGTSLNQFMREVAKESLKDGLTYIWIDNERVDSNSTKLEDKNVKPFLKIVKRSNVLSKKISYVNGIATLDQIVIRQIVDREVEGDNYKTEEKEVYIVLNKFGGKVYEIIKGKDILIDSWTNNLGIIPIVPVYSSKSGYLEADIPLLDLAFMNLKHFNKQSNLDSILKIAAVPVPTIFTDNEFDKETIKKEGVTVGATKALLFSNKTEHGFKFEEIAGSSIDKLQNDLEHVEEIMEKMSLSILTNGSFNTATEAKIADSNSNLFLLELANSLENGINAAFKVIELYIDIKLDILVEVNKDFNSIGLDSNTIDKYIALKREGLISIDTLWNELIKGEVLSINDFDLEKQKIKDEEVNL